MTESEPVLYREQGASWLALLFGPCFALAGMGFELLTGGPVFVALWVLVGVVLLGFTALWVYARRHFTAVVLTSTALRQGTEELSTARIVEVSGDEPPTGAKVLGGGLTAPRKYDELPLHLDDGSVVIAWARDGAALRDALHGTIYG